MSHRFLTSTGGLAIVIAVALLAPVPVAGQSASPQRSAQQTWTLPRTADGQPDLQGVWDLPHHHAAGATRRAGNEGVLYRRGSGELRTGRKPTPESRSDRSEAGRRELPGGRRRSLQRVLVRPRQQDREDKAHVVDRRSARWPASCHDAGRAEESGAARERRRATISLDVPTPTRGKTGRCRSVAFSGLNAGPPMTPGAYNNNVQLFQTPEYVVILNEMIHDARIVPLDGRPHGQHSASGREIRAATGRATRWSSTRRISSARRAFPAPARTRT